MGFFLYEQVHYLFFLPVVQEMEHPKLWNQELNFIIYTIW